MTIFAFVIFVTLLVWVAVQAAPTVAFVRALRRDRPALLADGDCPQAAILLSVRGDDPCLAQCVEGLLQQDYPRYTVRIVVDHVEDPAWKVIDRVVKRHPGSPVRYAWNAGAAVQMHWGRRTWGGGMAVRARLFRETDLRERWRHGIATIGALLAAAIVLVVAVARGQAVPAALAGGGLAAYGLAMFAMLGLLEATVRKAVQDRDERTQWLGIGTLLKLLIAVPLAQIVYAAVLPTVGFLRDVTWRGVSYRIEGRGVRLVRYEPYRRKGGSPASSHSL